nr:MAG TPA: hypothetical protein [Caudoviricetes sp.]
MDYAQCPVTNHKKPGSGRSRKGGGNEHYICG